MRATRRVARVAPEVRVLAVELERQRVRAVDVGLDDRRPALLEVAGELRLHARRVDRDRRRHDQQAGVVALPQLVDDRRHQPQHAARALELVERRPVAVEPVEQLGMDRVGGGEPPLVVALARLERELAPRASGRGCRRPLTTASRSRASSAGRSSNSRRRTISKPSSADAGLHDDSCRTITFLSRSSAALPASPPTSMSEAGIDTTSSAFLTFLAASASACANVNCASNEPAGRSSRRRAAARRRPTRRSGSDTASSAREQLGSARRQDSCRAWSALATSA